MYPADMQGGRATSAAFDPNALMPVPVPAPSPKPASGDQGIAIGNANLVWGDDGYGKTATTTIKNDDNQTVGKVVFDEATHIVTVTQYDKDTGKARTSTFEYDGEKVVKRGGSLASEQHQRNAASGDAADPIEFYSSEPYQVVTLQNGSENTPPIKVEIGHNLAGGDQYDSPKLGAFIEMPSKPGTPGNAAVKTDELLIRAGGPFDDDGGTVDPRRLIAQYSPRGGNPEGDKTYISSMPAHDFLGDLGNAAKKAAESLSLFGSFLLE